MKATDDMTAALELVPGRIEKVAYGFDRIAESSNNLSKGLGQAYK
jgi:hypothetical protein